MKNLPYLDEFKKEAANAMFTKQQAISATLQLLQAEGAKAENSEKETAMFNAALKKAEFKYIDNTTTKTDAMLDSLGVARFTTEEITSAIDSLLFDVE